MAWVSAAFEVRIEWLEAPGVTSPELAATWARYEIWVGRRCASQVETSDGTLRRSLFGSVYPLAEWIAENWWVLTFDVRPSAVEGRFWSWPNVRAHPWLRQHNLCAAGNGMAWPDVTVVSEGPVTRVRWAPEDEAPHRSVRFSSVGSAAVKAADIAEGLVSLVDAVLTRLSEQGLPKTRLAEEWGAVAKADDEEKSFCSTVARLGLDPYAVDELFASEVIEVLGGLPNELRTDFLDSVNPLQLGAAADWVRRAQGAAERAATKTSESLRSLYEATSAVTRDRASDGERPWLRGYSLARLVRRELAVVETEPFDAAPWVGTADVGANAHGLQGLARVENDRCGLVLGAPGLPATAARFGRARALGRVLARPVQRSFVLSSCWFVRCRAARSGCRYSADA